MKTYGIMLIGCGHIGQEHIQDIYFRKEFTIEAVIDRSAELAEEFRHRYGAKSCGTDYRCFLSDPAIDIVIIATYADSHLSILKDCMAAGKHVLCEKPIARSMSDAREFCRVVESADTKVLVAHILRHNRSYQTIAQMIHSGAIGPLRLMRMVQNHHAMNWDRYKRLMQDCPPIVDCGVHYLDVMQWFSGSKIAQVSGISTKLDPDSPCDNFGMIHVRMENGCIGYYEAGWGKNISAQNVKEFVGEDGRITLTLQSNRACDSEEGDLITLYRYDTGEYQTKNVPAKYKDMYAQLRSLVDMIEQDAPANPGMDDVFRAFRAAFLANAAIRENRILTISEEEMAGVCPAKTL